MKLKHLIILLSIGNLCILYTLSYYSQPTTIRLSELPDYAGKQVIVQGRIINQYTTSFGNQILEITDPEENHTAHATIYLEDPVTYNYGDTIQATGTVQQYQNTWEVIVDTLKNIQRVEQWNETNIPLKQLAASPEQYVGMNLHITGQLDRLYDSFCYITDYEESYSLAVFFDTDNYPQIDVGACISIGGRFEFDKHALRYQLTVSEKEHFLYTCEETE